MMTAGSRLDGCPSDFAFDRRLAGELETDDDEQISAHLATCTPCRGRWDELRAARDAFVDEAPPLRLKGRPTSSAGRSRRPWVVASSALIAAAAALFLVRGVGRDVGTRAKGSGVRVEYYVNHAGVVRAGGPNDPVEPGDALRFVYTTKRVGYLAVLSLDAKKNASVYYPTTAGAARIEPGTAVPLPTSTVLDDTVGEETIYGVFCSDPFDLEPLRRSLEAAPERAPSPEGCEVDAIDVRKVARLP
jgi:hypothetical protein